MRNILAALIGIAVVAPAAAAKDNLQTNSPHLPLPRGGSNALRQTMSSLAQQSINFDLTNSSASISAGQVLGGHHLNLRVGGSEMQVRSQTLLTPAEFMAVMQMESGAKQSLVLSSQGTATGGFAIWDTAKTSASSLVIPSGVSVVALTQTGEITVPGGVTTNGNLYIASTNPNVNVFSLTTSSFNVGGTVTTDLRGTNFGINAPVANRALSVLAINDLRVRGTLSSTGDVYLFTGSGSIFNSGTVTSKNGSIGIATIDPTGALNIDARGGAFHAVSGNISVRDGSYSGSDKLTMLGGDYVAQSVNLSNGTGEISASIRRITGPLNVVGGVVNVVADTNTLFIGSQTIATSASYRNTQDMALVNSIVTNGAVPLSFMAGNDFDAYSSLSAIVNPGGAVSITANRNVGIHSIDTSVQGTQGGNAGVIAITAGGTVVADSSILATGANNRAGNGGTGGDVTISGANLSLQAIDVSGGNAGATATGGTGGNLTLTASNGGINTGSLASLGGNAGSCALNGGGTGGNGGNISLAALGGGVHTDGGIRTTGGFGGASVAQAGGNGGNGGAVGIASSGAIEVVNGAITTSGAAGGNGTSVGAGGAAGWITLTGGTSVSLESVQGNGGNAGSYSGQAGAGAQIIIVATNGDITTGNISANAGKGMNGVGGNVGITAIGNATIGSSDPSNPMASISSRGSAQGGNVSVAASNTVSLRSLSSVNNVIDTSSGCANGGNVQLYAGGTSGEVISLSNGNISTLGGPDGANGNLTIVFPGSATVGTYTWNESPNPSCCLQPVGYAEVDEFVVDSDSDADV